MLPAGARDMLSNPNAMAQMQQMMSGMGGGGMAEMMKGMMGR